MYACIDSIARKGIPMRKWKKLSQAMIKESE